MGRLQSMGVGPGAGSEGRRSLTDPLAAVQQERPRLLVVDDQPVNIQALYQVFAADHQVLMATSGEQALRMCATMPPDLVLLDIEMPGMDGYEVCRRLRADPATSDIPVIFITAHDDEETETRGLDAGAVDFIVKPIKPRIVRARVKAHVAQKIQADLLRQWVYIDGLTAIANRRSFDEVLDTEWRRARRHGTPLSVALIDVDFFKRYNDRYGHQLGDDCLRRVAAALKSQLRRPGDMVARYGGEEFVCLLPETGLEGALQLAEYLRQQVLSEAIEHLDSEAAPVVSVSVGVCTHAVDGTGEAADLLREADAQLYRAKTQGRNQVCGAELMAPAAGPVPASEAGALR